MNSTSIEAHPTTCSVVATQAWVALASPLPSLEPHDVRRKPSCSHDGLLLAALESNTEDAAFLTNFLSGLHQFNRLYISPFGFKFTPANVIQVFVPVLAALAQVVGKQMLV